MFHHINISDIHGVAYGDPYNFYQDELVEIIEYILDNEVDLITIAGDLFHTIYKADSLEINVMMKFMHQLITAASTKDAAVRLIRGTDSHDYDQLQLFDNYETDDWCDVKIIEKPTNEEFPNGLVFKYLPEEYTEDYNEYKKDNLIDDVDVVVFHGLVEGALKYAEGKQHKEVVLGVDDLYNCMRLYTVGGHIHTRTFITDDIWYSGSFSAKDYNDANEKKGFDHIVINDAQKDYEIKFIENENAPKFITKDLSEDFMISSKDTIRARLLSISKDKREKEHIRIDVDSSNLNQKQKDTLSFLQVKFRTIFDFKVYKDEIDTEDKVIKKKVEKANRILDKDVPIEDKIESELKEYKDKFELTDDDIDINKIKDLIDKKN